MFCAPQKEKEYSAQMDAWKAQTKVKGAPGARRILELEEEGKPKRAPPKASVKGFGSK